MISIIIVNYNSENYLSKCIESIINSDINIKKIEIIIINNSRDYINHSIKNKAVNIKVIHIGKNIGYSKAINIGIRESLYSTIITMNPDVIVKNTTINNMYKYFVKNINIGVLGCRVLNPNKSFQLSSRRKIPISSVIIPYIFKFHYLGFINN